jgi:hypothetical protein
MTTSETPTRQVLIQAIRTLPFDLGASLCASGWMDSLRTDEMSAFTALFEEHGYLGARTNALDFAIAAVMGLDRCIPFVWPLDPDGMAADVGGSGMVVMDGAVQRGGMHARTLLCPVNSRLVAVAVSSVDPRITGEGVAHSPWVRVQVWCRPTRDLEPWSDIRRLASLALASELVGVARRIADDAAIHKQPGRDTASEMATGPNSAQTSATIAEARAAIAASWADGSLEAAERAVSAAAVAQDVVAGHVARVCGNIKRAQLHPMRLLAEESRGRIHRDLAR